MPGAFDPEGELLAESRRPTPRVGVLASQGGFAAHVAMLERLGVESGAVRTAEGFEDLDALVIPGGESTVIAKAIERDGLEDPILRHAGAGKPILGTCAGMIICSRNHLGLVDADAERNAFGRQIASFEDDIELEGIGPEPIRAAFIRAPWLTGCGPDVRVLACRGERVVAARQGRVLVCSFHPELGDDLRIHAMMLAMIDERAPDSPIAGEPGREATRR